MDSHLCEDIVVETKVPQGSPVSPVLFAIYFSVVFREVEQEVERYIAMSFAVDCGRLVVADSVEQLCQWLEIVGIKAVE